jgi:hypothetical protein
MKRTKYFHNYEYRHLLRSPDCYKEFKSLKFCPSIQWWENKYNHIHKEFKNAGLDPNGFSLQHTAIIDKVLKFKGRLIVIYHENQSI